MEKQQARLRTSVLPWVFMGLTIIPVFYLHFTALRAADDFYYATFWRNGPAEFWRLVVEHYNTFNGRAFVHLVAQTVLAFPPIVFAVVNTLLLCGSGMLSARLGNEPYKGRALPRTVFFFLAQLLLLPTRVLTEGLLWASASYNYMLPVFLTMLALWFLSRFLERAQTGGAFGALFFLIQLTAGATTEQSGFMAAASTGVYGLCWAVRVKKGWWRLFLAPLLNGVGYLTIFLSPATRVRAVDAFEWALLRARLGQMIDAFFSWDGILLQVIVTGVLLTTCLLNSGTRRKLDRSIPALLAGAGAGMLIMVPAGNFDPRVMLPVALMLLLVSARCAAELLGLLKAGSPAAPLLGAALLSVCITVCSPLLAGAAENYAIELRNRTAVRQALKTGALFYCIDYGEQWCYPKLMYSEDNYYRDFLAANGVTDCMVYLQSAYMKSVYLNGQCLSSPAYTQDGKVFFSLRDVIEGLGGTVLYKDGGTIYVTLYGQKRTFLPAGVVTWSDENGRQEYPTAGKAVTHYRKACYTAELYKAVFGIDITLEADHYICKKEALT